MHIKVYKMVVGGSGPMFVIERPKLEYFSLIQISNCNKTDSLWYLLKKNYIGNTEAVMPVINSSRIIFVTVSSDVTANILSLKKGRNINS